jgi:hypothetical protein
MRHREGRPYKEAWKPKSEKNDMTPPSDPVLKDRLSLIIAKQKPQIGNTIFVYIDLVLLREPD